MLDTSSSSTCGRGPNVNLSIGGQGTVTPGLHNNVRSAPGSTNREVGQLNPGEVFNVIGGPECAQGLQWWQVSRNGMSGWTAAGLGNDIWLASVSGGSNSASPSIGSGSGSSGGNGSQTYPEPGPPPPQLPHPCPDASSGCIRTEWGTNATIRPATIVRGTCRDQSDQDWLVTFDMSQNQDWNNADESRIRLGISRSYLRGTLPGLLNNRVQVDTYSPPNIVICLGGNRFPTENSIRNNTWLWLRAQ